MAFLSQELPQGEERSPSWASAVTHWMQSDERDSIKIIRTCPRQAASISEKLLGLQRRQQRNPPWVRRCATTTARKLFLMTKIDGQTKKAAAAQIDEFSFQRPARTDHIAFSNQRGY